MTDVLSALVQPPFEEPPGRRRTGRPGRSRVAYGVAANLRVPALLEVIV
jgi:hypothetical protein